MCRSQSGRSWSRAAASAARPRLHICSTCTERSVASLCSPARRPLAHVMAYNRPFSVAASSANSVAVVDVRAVVGMICLAAVAVVISWSWQQAAISNLMLEGAPNSTLQFTMSAALHGGALVLCHLALLLVAIRSGKAPSSRWMRCIEYLSCGVSAYGRLCVSHSPHAMPMMSRLSARLEIFATRPQPAGRAPAWCAIGGRVRVQVSPNFCAQPRAPSGAISSERVGTAAWPQRRRRRRAVEREGKRHT